MSKKKKNQREAKRENGNEYKWEDIKEEKKEVKKETKESEGVILMGAPRVDTKEVLQFKEETVKISIPKNEGKGVKIDFGQDVEHTTASEEELKNITNTKKTISTQKEHTSLGKMFLGLLALFVAYLIVGQIFDMFGPTTISLLALWPLLIMFIGLSLFKVKKRGMGRIFAGFIVLIVFVASISLVFKGGDIVRIHTTGIVATEERGVDPFSSIYFDGIGTLKITEGDREAVIISGDEVVVGEVLATIKNNTLVLKYNNLLWALFLFEETSIDVEVITRDISKIVISGKANVEIDGARGETLDFTLSGDGNVNIQNVFFDDIVVRIVGNGNVTTSGAVNREYVFLSGVGSYDGTTLVSSEAGVRISGVGDVRVSPTNELNVSITGVGDVIYKGEPVITGKSVTGVGNIMSESEAAEEDKDSKTIEDKADSMKVDLEKEPAAITPKEADTSGIVSNPKDFLKSLKSVLE